MADRREMHADLMRTARLQAQAQQARARERLAQLEMRDGGPLAAAADRHAADVVAIAADGRVDGAAARGRPSAHQRDVLALDRPRAHLLAQRGEGLVAAREHEQPGRVAVEPVDDARALVVVAPAQAVAAQGGHAASADGEVRPGAPPPPSLRRPTGRYETLLPPRQQVVPSRCASNAKLAEPRLRVCCAYRQAFVLAASGADERTVLRHDRDLRFAVLDVEREVELGVGAAEILGLRS